MFHQSLTHRASFSTRIRIRASIAALAFFIFSGLSALQVSAQSALDGFDPNANGVVRAVVVQSDGKIIIGGDFTTILGATRNRIARLNTDGTLDAAFNPNADDTVFSIAVQSDGKVVAGGFFTHVSGQTQNFIARLDATTGAADSFNPNANNGVSAVAVQPDGKILAGGYFTNIGGQPRSRIARIDPATGLADTFNPNANYTVSAITVQTDGRIIIGGGFSMVSGQTRNGIARLDPATGALDAFNPNAIGVVSSIAVQADGKVLAGGNFTTIGGQPRNRIARLNGTTGAPDSFDPNASGNSVESITLQTDGKILAGGQFSSIGGQTRNNIARIDPVTALADSFDPNASGTILAIAVQPDGKVLAGGAFATVSPNGAAAVARNNIARFERDGLLDRTLNLNLSGSIVYATAVQPDGKILIGGTFDTILGAPRRNIARLNSDGTLDTTFVADTNATQAQVYAVAVLPDGKIMVGGAFSSIGGQTRTRLARLNANGSVDTFNQSADNFVYSIAVQPDGRILVGGSFSNITPGGGGAAVPRGFIARFNADDTLDAAFNPSADGIVNSITAQSDGKILVGGNFSNIGGLPRVRLARLDTVGAADSFNPIASTPGGINAVAIQSDGRIIVGGGFTSITPNDSSNTPVTRNRVARFNSDGTLDAAFDPNASGVVNTIAVQSDGKILIGGGFSSVGVAARSRIARLDGMTGAPDSFDPNASSTVQSIVIQPDGKILLGGQFVTVGGTSRNRFARITNDTAALSALSVTKTSVTLTRDGSAPQFARVIFEQSTDNGATYTSLGTATNGFDSIVAEKQSEDQLVQLAPQASGYTLNGLNLPTGQNILIRARGFYRTGYQSGSEAIEDKTQTAYFLAPTAAGVSISGRVMIEKDSGLPKASVTLTDSRGYSQTALTDRRGNFRFENIQAGETYFLTVMAKRYTYAPQVIFLTEDTTEINFAPQ